MAESIKVSTQVLKDTAQDVRIKNTNLDDKLKEINKAMNQLEQSWKSEAGSEIRNKMNALQPRFEEYKNVIESYAKFLDKTAQDYETTEATVKSNASQFR